MHSNESFFGIELSPSTVYTYTVTQYLQFTMAVLKNANTSAGRTSIYLKLNNVQFTICTLMAEKIEQQVLNLKLQKGLQIELWTSGANPVQLLGTFTSDNETDSNSSLEQVSAIAKEHDEEDDVCYYPMTKEQRDSLVEFNSEAMQAERQVFIDKFSTVIDILDSIEDPQPILDNFLAKYNNKKRTLEDIERIFTPSNKRQKTINTADLEQQLRVSATKSKKQEPTKASEKESGNQKKINNKTSSEQQSKESTKKPGSQKAKPDNNQKATANDNQKATASNNQKATASNNQKATANNNQKATADNNQKTTTDHSQKVSKKPERAQSLPKSAKSDFKNNKLPQQNKINDNKNLKFNDNKINKNKYNKNNKNKNNNNKKNQNVKDKKSIQKQQKQKNKNPPKQADKNEGVKITLPQ